MRLRYVIVPMFALASVAFGAVAAGCKAEAQIGSKEPTPPPPPPPTPEPVAEATPAPTPAPEPPKKVVKVKGVTMQGNKVQIPGKLEFDFNSAKLRETKQTQEILNTLLDFLKQNPNVTKIRVEGHTDDKGGADYNKDLSQKRADSVASWLASKGIDKARLTTSGFGMDRPEVPNSSDENREKNRRVEFHVQEMDGKAVSEPPKDAPKPAASAAPSASVAKPPVPAASTVPSPANVPAPKH